MKFPLIAAVALIAALPVFAQDAAPDEALPPAETDILPPGGDAPVDEIPPIADVAPDGGSPDATAIDMACTFETECNDAECASSGYQGRLTIISDGAGLAEGEWADPSETISLSAIVTNGTVLASSSGSETGKQRLLTVLPDGKARFTTHLTDPIMAITYIGSCEVAK
ncbi:hypothetical protein FQV27_11745 [Paracoccus aurantiacus]|uniref:Uncharacterized protein n=1 Tax=Paracoccus aurantiacus TaxID=2599412 RepID=A0A5C6S499_9RHOB|nr:hypothetical protein [Paracoccus aurantiacus]TXB68651.1 hypothetical protein FQV27_11745 [Paracoccus aurantiacus]